MFKCSIFFSPIVLGLGSATDKDRRYLVFERSFKITGLTCTQGKTFSRHSSLSFTNQSQIEVYIADYMRDCNFLLKQPVITISWIQHGAGAPHQLGAICIATALSAGAGLDLTLLPQPDVMLFSSTFNILFLRIALQ